MDIRNEAVLHLTAIANIEPLTLEDSLKWFLPMLQENLPVRAGSCPNNQILMCLAVCGDRS